MNKLFIHTPVFRLVSPFFSGIVAYALILMINNRLGELQEQFLGEEVYVCIGLAFIVHEFSRFLLWVFALMPRFFGTAITLLVYLAISIVTIATIIVLLISGYYLYILGYAPLLKELQTFVGMYCSIPVVYVFLNLSHQYLHKINTQQLNNELLIKENIEADFKQFKREVNPTLLFECFEVLLLLIKGDKDLVDGFIDHLSSIYRYILASKKKQLVAVNEELEIVEEFIKLYNYLPYRKIELRVNCDSDFLIVPGTIVYIIEQIIKTTIVSTDVNLEIIMESQGDSFRMRYVKEEKITDSFTHEKMEGLDRVYSMYTSESIALLEEKNQNIISIPTLKINE